MPIIGLFAGALFNNSAWVATSAYFIGVAAVIVSGIILKKFKMFAGDPGAVCDGIAWLTIFLGIQCCGERGTRLVVYQAGRYDHSVKLDCLVVLTGLGFAGRRLPGMVGG